MGRMEKVKIAIVGKARLVPPEELMQYDEVWTVGTNPIEANMYLCLHGEQTRHPEKETSWGDLEWLPEAYKGAPLVNSICVMLAVLAAMVSAEFCCPEIHILASPLIATKERIEERPAVAYWVGVLQGLGATVYWEGGFKRALPYMWEDHASKGTGNNTL